MISLGITIGGSTACFFLTLLAYSLHHVSRERRTKAAADAYPTAHTAFGGGLAWPLSSKPSNSLGRRSSGSAWWNHQPPGPELEKGGLHPSNSFSSSEDGAAGESFVIHDLSQHAHVPEMARVFVRDGLKHAGGMGVCVHLSCLRQVVCVRLTNQSDSICTRSVCRQSRLCSVPAHLQAWHMIACT